MEETSLEGLFFEGPTASTGGTRWNNENLKSWLCRPAPCIDDIPKAVDLQKEADMQFAAIRQPKKFTSPLMKVNALESKSQGPYASQHGIHFNTKVTPNTGNTRAVNVTATYPWFSSGNKEAPGTDFLPPEQNLLKSQDISGSPSLLRRSLFRTFEEEQMLTYNHSMNTEKSYKTDSNRPFHQNPLVHSEDDVHGASGGLDEETFDFPSSIALLTGKAETQCGILRPVSEIPKQFRAIFKEFPYFNYIQSKALDDLLYSDKNFVMCAPTGSGKTVLFEIAIVRLLMEVPAPWTNLKIVYMAPIKALCGQRFDNWKEKFEPIGLQCKELTGDTEVDDLFEIQHAHIIMTTPEKWDAMSRKWRDNTLVQLVRLFLIDEVHTLKDENRGATLEVVVSRMKTMQVLLASTNSRDLQLPMRFVAVSATIPNANDIAEWLSDGQCQAICMKMDESHRPVKLRKVVLGYPSGANQTEYKFDITLNYKVAGVIQTYSDQKPTLVFCATRKGVQQAASILAKDAKFIMSIEHKQRLQKSANAVKDGKLRDLILYGVGYHHAGIDVADRKIVEATFTEGDLPVLFTTSTLAMGVNLPAHLVVIKSTMHYASGMFQEYSETDILQMIGRAGRPQFDSTATAVIMTRSGTKEKYIQMLDGADTIESSLHRHLVEHLNAEITLHTITDVNIALEWIRSTFLYIRTLKNPSHYGFQRGLDKVGIEAELQELCLKNLNELSSVGLIEMDEDVNFKPTETGKLIASYYIAFDTAKLFYSIHGKETLSEMVTIISLCKEFSDIQLRTSEKKLLNTLNKDRNRITISLIQAQLGCIPVQDFSLTQDMAKIFRHGIRVTKYLHEFLALQEKKFMAFLNALILAKCFRCKLWENSSHVSKQLEKIGVTLANAMVNAGLTSFKKIEDTNPRELELIVNRNPPFGNQIKESVLHLPTYNLSIEQLAKYNISEAEIVVTVLLTNFERLQKKRTAPDSHHVTLLIGDSNNNLVFKQKIRDSALLKSGTWTRKINIKRVFTSDELSVNLISSEYVGLDIQQKFRAVYFGTQRLEPNIDAESMSESKHLSNSNMQLISGYPSLQSVLKTGMRECNHHCKNKDACAHECCKIGVSHKADSKTNSNFSSYLSDLRSRNSVSSALPVKRLKMQGERTTSLEKFVYTPKPAINAFLRPTTMTATAAQTATQEPFHDNQRSYTDQPPDGASCIYSGNKAYGTPQSENITDYQKKLADIDNYRSWSVEPASVTFDLGSDVWDNFDDDSLLVDSSFVTSVEAPILGSSTVPLMGDITTKYSSSTAQQENTGFNSMDLIKKNTEYTIQNHDLGNKGTSNYRPYGKKPDDSEQYLENRKYASGVYNACQSGDLFISHATAHGNDNRDEETQTFIGIFDGIF